MSQEPAVNQQDERVAESRPSWEPTVFIVDDDPAIRKSLRWLIESVGLDVEAFASAQEFLAAYTADRPGCLVLDVRMRGMSGLELQDVLRERGCTIPVIIVTGYGDVPMAVRAMKAGAVYFIEKPVSDQVLLEQIERAIIEDARTRRGRSERRMIHQRIESLTPREREVLKLVVAGRSSREIADDLGVSPKTVDAHRAKIMQKMHARSVPHLIRMSLIDGMSDEA